MACKSVYADLHEDRDEIRLLLLAPLDQSSKVSGTLVTVPLSHKPLYEALSYAWEEKTPEYIVTLCDQHFTVTPNLFAALLQLRLPGHIRVLWVDSICINQQDLRERNSQVLLMEDIYRGCAKGIIWLGPADKTLKSVEIFETWTKSSHLSKRDNFSPESLDVVKTLMGRKWWSRTWTVQETVLPKELQVCYGPHTWNWDTFAKAATSLRKHLTSCCRKFNDNKNECSVTASRFILAVQAAEELRSRSPRKNDILPCLQSFRTREATDPRDKIYGLLSLANLPRRDWITIDYTASAQSVYIDFATSQILRSGSLEILTLAFQSDKGQKGLPSWVPDWSIPMKEPTWQQGRISRNKLYNASYGLASNTSFDADGRVLVETGFLFDVVSTVGQVRDSQMGPGIPKNWLQKAKDESDLGLEKARHKLWRTILMDTMRTTNTNVGVYKRASIEDYREFDSWKKIVTNGESWPRNDDRLNLTLETATMIRRFFVSSNGYFGLGPELVKEGDEIYILPGSACPLILRSNPQHITADLTRNGSTTKQFHTYVGDCYVDSIMDGEAVKSSSFPLQTLFLK